METAIAFDREAGQGLDDDTIPAYASMLAAYHRAQASKLRAMLTGLPLRPGDRVLDMACGDGCYAVWLAELVAPHGVVVAVDRSPAYLALAQRETAGSPHVGNISLQTGDIAALPFDDGTFDLCWCAQSMYSLPDPVAALRELRRVTRPGGTVAVLENDTLHGIVLPWPADLELTVRQAQLRAIAETEPDTARFFIGRDLCAVFELGGLNGCTITPHTALHRTPLCCDERTYLTWYLDDLRARAPVPHAGRSGATRPIAGSGLACLSACSAGILCHLHRHSGPGAGSRTPLGPTRANASVSPPRTRCPRRYAERYTISDRASIPLKPVRSQSTLAVGHGVCMRVT